MPSPSPPSSFDGFLRETRAVTARIPGYTTDREGRFLAVLGAFPTATGEVLEIGSFRGHSTVLLALAAAYAGQPTIHAVDPMFPHAAPDPQTTALAAFRANLERAGAAAHVRFHHMLSGDLARDWSRPLRLLWVDGDHRYDGVKADVDGFAPHLTDGAILAMDDVLHPFTGCLRVFVERVLDSDHYGPVGLCGAIGWAQYNSDPALSAAHARAKRRLRRKLSRLLPFMTGEPSRGLRRLRYNVLRAAVPHGEVDPREWLAAVRIARRATIEPGGSGVD